MCVAMGRSIVSVIFGGAGTPVSASSGEAAVMEGEITIGSVDNLVESLMDLRCWIKWRLSEVKVVRLVNLCKLLILVS